MTRLLVALTATALFACSSPTTTTPPVTRTTPTPTPTAKGASLGAAKTLVIDADGGTLASDDGAFALEVPAGAVSTPTTFSLEPIENLAHGGVGSAWRVGPDGTTFTTPATVRFTAGTTALRAANVGGLGVAFQGADGLWTWVRDAQRDSTAHTVAVTTTHLSDWSLVLGQQLRPLSAVVPKGGSLGLEIWDCYPAEGLDPLASLTGYECGAYVIPLTDSVGAWSVNGTPGGDATHGTVAEQPGGAATFTAPGSRPTPPTVAVSVRLATSMQRGEQVTLLSQVTIGTVEKYAGTFQLGTTQAGISYSVEANATLTLKDDGPDETNYSMTGTAEMKTVTFQLGDATCVVDQPASHAIDETYAVKVRKDPALALRWSFADMWTYTCTSPNGMQSPWSVTLLFNTMQGAGCNTPDDRPLADVNLLDDAWTMTCNLAGPVSAKWHFIAQ